MITPSITAVLAEVNRLRAEHKIGEPLHWLPVGSPKQCYACPLSKALSTKRSLAQVGRTDADLGIKHGGVIELSPILVDFIGAFDAGAYPGLLAG